MRTQKKSHSNLTTLFSDERKSCAFVGILMRRRMFPAHRGYCQWNSSNSQRGARIRHLIFRSISTRVFISYCVLHLIFVDERYRDPFNSGRSFGLLRSRTGIARSKRRLDDSARRACCVVQRGERRVVGTRVERIAQHVQSASSKLTTGIILCDLVKITNRLQRLRFNSDVS